MSRRQATERRQTRETEISVTLDLDGSGQARVATGIGMLDHMLEALARHSRFDLTLEATGDLHTDQHHTVEDVALTLGKALAQALGERRGIVRMGHAVVPLDEALALVAVDLGGRGYASVETSFAGQRVGELQTDLIGHFFESLAAEARMNIHIRLLAGSNDHHKVEAMFKALARALDQATRLDPRLGGEVPSTKGKID
ncbi:MAG: imidazoleglycerol-phosphate dehydratase HisB [Chloroflexi bacterium]|nr:imidazoleglycerol-phosphate dehydratase HisB [Chloroflexota bacterium]